MPDVFEISSMTDAIQGYLDAKKHRNVFEMEKKQREAEIMLNTMQEKRLREQMLQTGKFQQEELGERKQQFQQTYGLQEKLFSEQQRATKAEEERLSKETESRLLLQDISRRLGTVEADIAEKTKSWTMGAVEAEARGKIATARGVAKSYQETFSPENIEARYIEREAKKAQDKLAIGTAEAGLELVDQQKQSALAELATKQEQSELNLQWMIDNGTTEEIERIKASQEQLRLTGEQIKNQTTELGIRQQQLNLATWEFEEAKKNPRISLERLFEFEQKKLDLTIQLDLLDLSTRLTEANIPPAISTQLSELFQDQMLKIGQGAPPEEVNQLTEQAKQLGSIYGITVTSGTYKKALRFRGDKHYTIIAGMSTKNVSLITNDQVQSLISNIKKSVGITDTIIPTPEEQEKIRQERDKLLGGAGTTTTTQPPPLVTNRNNIIQAWLTLARQQVSQDVLSRFERSNNMTEAEVAEAIRLLGNK